MRIGIAIEETWSFLHEIYDELTNYHQTSLFQRRHVHFPVFYSRINHYYFKKDLQAFMRKNDVVFFEWASALLAAATHLPKQTGIVTRLHRYEMNEWVDRINWDNVDKIILVSEAKKQEFIERFPQQGGKIEVIYEAVDPEKFQSQTRPFNGDIGILCHLTPRKRVYELILTFYELSQKRSDLHLHIAGGPHVKYGDYFYAMQDIIKKLNLQGKVTFYGNITNPKEWYHNIDIFISNAYSEGLQVALLEAMASGRYCLAHRWAGVEELLPKSNLFYTDSELQEKILHYCDLAEEMKQEKQQFMRTRICEGFNMNESKVRIRQLIEEIG